MKRFISLVLVVTLLVGIGAWMTGCGEKEDQESQEDKSTTSSDILDGCSLVIESARIVKLYSSHLFIVTYAFGNVKEENAISFDLYVNDQVYQGGIKLEHPYIFDEIEGYDSANQFKEIKKGTTIKVQVAYELENTEDEIEVEVGSGLLSKSKKKIKRVFTVG